MELSGPPSLCSPFHNIFSTGREFDDPAVAITIADIKSTVGRYGNIGGSVEMCGVTPGNMRFAKCKQKLAVRRIFKNLVQSYIRQPDIPLCIHGKPMRHHKCARTPAV